MGWGIKRKLVTGNVIEYYSGDNMIFTNSWTQVINQATIFNDDRDASNLTSVMPNGYLYSLVRMGRYDRRAV